MIHIIIAVLYRAIALPVAGVLGQAALLVLWHKSWIVYYTQPYAITEDATDDDTNGALQGVFHISDAGMGPYWPMVNYVIMFYHRPSHPNIRSGFEFKA